MNDWNLLEKRLAGWTPRPPSSRVEKRIFSDPPGNAASPALGWSWLAPVMGCFLMLTVISNPRQATLEGTSSGAPHPHAPWASASGAQPGYAAYLAGSAHSGQNALPREHFVWNNQSLAPAQTGTPVLAQTNGVKQ
jgi:hypothetical protein